MSYNISNLIIGIHGKKQSGKDTLADNILEYVRQKVYSGTCKYEYLRKKINFADYLKEISINLFEIEEKQCFGSDDDKNSEVDIYWSDIIHLIDCIEPGYNQSDALVLFLMKQGIINQYPHVTHSKHFDIHKGPAIRLCNRFVLPDNSLDWKMSAREFFQYFGTDIIRRLNPDAWVNAWVAQVKSKINNDKSNVIVAADIRFINETESIKKINKTIPNAVTILIKLRRGVLKDSHGSEKELSDTLFDFCVPDGTKQDTLKFCIEKLENRGLI